MAQIYYGGRFIVTNLMVIGILDILEPVGGISLVGKDLNLLFFNFNLQHAPLFGLILHALYIKILQYYIQTMDINYIFLRLTGEIKCYRLTK